jgi:lipoprotein-releasing system ATP-binding protein
MVDINREQNTSLLIVTHDRELAGRMDRVLTLQDGQLLAD